MKVVYIDLPKEELDRLVAALHGLVDGIGKALQAMTEEEEK